MPDSDTTISAEENESSSEKTEDNKTEVILSLISHTNVGKTALARTLLRRDVGEVADRAHVTVSSEAYTLLESDEAIAKLWDTPGFGSNLAKLAKRIRSSGNPVGWILHQVWDRFKDESLWCSQEAIRNIREDADLVIYLVDASQSPDSVGYVDLEMEILGWIGKPVLVFLNQIGRPDPERIVREEEEWRLHLESFEVVKGVDTLDAFTRCWTEEHQILEQAAEHLDGGKKKAANQLAKAWIDRNIDVFEKSIDKISDLLFFALTDHETVSDTTIAGSIKSLVDKNGQRREMESIKDKMMERLQAETITMINQLVALQGIDGKSARKLLDVNLEENIIVNRNVQESIASVLGGVATGAATGVGADVLSGGLTLGGGLIVGSVLGAAGGFALAKGFNLAKADKNRVRWTATHFFGQVLFQAEIFLAVSHFGRGQGLWQDNENSPDHWKFATQVTVEKYEEKLKDLWKKAAPEAQKSKLRDDLRSTIRQILVDILIKLYPDSKGIFK